MAELTISSDEIRSAIANYTSSYSAEASREEVGVVTSAADGIAQVSGLPGCMTNELLEFPNGVIGVAQNLETDSIGVVVLGNFETLSEGDEVKRTGEVLSIPVGENFLGRVINPLGQPIDGLGPIESQRRACPGAPGRRRARPPAGRGAAANRPQGDRRHDADRPRPASAHHW